VTPSVTSPDVNNLIDATGPKIFQNAVVLFNTHALNSKTAQRCHVKGNIPEG